MTGLRPASLAVAALLAASPSIAQIRSAPVVVPVPGAAAGIAVVGVAASLRPQSALPTAPTLGLPVSVLPTPASALASLTQSARAEASLRATLPSALPTPGVAAEALSAPSSPANEARPSRRDERPKAMLDEIAAATGWKAGKPDAALASLSRRDRPIDAAKIGAQLNTLFDGMDAKPSAGAVSVEALEPAPPAKGSVAGPALLAEVRAKTRQGHRGISYEEAKSLLFSKADSVVERGVRGVRDAYSGVFVPGSSDHGGDYEERGDADGDGYHETKGMNVEHLWPQSYFSEKLPMRGDLHHLMATFQHPNGMRGRLPFDEVPDDRVEYHNNAGARMGAGVFEPPDSAKGRVARAMLYFMARYGDQGVLPGNVVSHFWNARIETLMRWNRQFPPTQFEVDRNSVVEKLQGNRNPFVDDPALAERVGVEGFRMDGGRKSLARASEPGSGTQYQGRSAPQKQKHRDGGRRRNNRNNRRW
ncbi:MAG: hypothetical protein FD126_2446 [Elusimicrobia bacterium]|nr:MAG: hypothetical protein FD126_2446 [Elusimicrobiota bacterium]